MGANLMLMGFVFKTFFFAACLKSHDLIMARFCFQFTVNPLSQSLSSWDMKEKNSRLANSVPQGIKEAASNSLVETLLIRTEVPFVQFYLPSGGFVSNKLLLF